MMWWLCKKGKGQVRFDIPQGHDERGNPSKLEFNAGVSTMLLCGSCQYFGWELYRIGT
jgi:hypothetical protein